MMADNDDNDGARADAVVVDVTDISNRITAAQAAGWNLIVLFAPCVVSGQVGLVSSGF